MKVNRWIDGQTRQSVWWVWGVLSKVRLLRLRAAIPRDYVIALPGSSTWGIGFHMPWRFRRKEG